MEERSIGKDAIEGIRREIKSQKFLAPDFTTRVSASHFAKSFTSVEPGGEGAPITQRLEVTPGPTAEIKHTAAFALIRQAGKQRLDILRDVVIAGTLPEGVSSLFVVP